MRISRSKRPCPTTQRRGKPCAPEKVLGKRHTETLVRAEPSSSGQGLDKPVVCITMGYPAGIGPEIIVKSLASSTIRGLANFLIIGDEFVFKRAQRLCKKRFKYSLIKQASETDFRKSNILFLDLRNVSYHRFCFGRLCPPYGKASIEYIKEAVFLIKSKKADIVVTAPIHKHAAELSGFRYSGHTEYLAHLTDTKGYAMMLMGGPLKVVLVTTHLPIKEVSPKLKKQRIVNILGLTDRSLKQYFGISRPRIAVCGLNPHAGEAGTLGDEDERIIRPAVERARKKRIDAYGPLAADAVFYELYKGGYDCAVCMYHDQGLVALKMIARDKSVNVTLGLPFIRTSPGHGTALDIAAKGIASSQSMEEAIKTAVGMFKR